MTIGDHDNNGVSVAPSATRGILATVGASACLATAPAAVKLGLGANADAMALLVPRMWIGTALLWAFVALTRPARLRISAQVRWDCMVAGAVNAIGLSMFYLGLTRIDASIAVVVFSLYPAILLALLSLRGEAVTRRDGIRLVLALVGVWLLAGPGGQVDPYGVALMLGTAAIYSVYTYLVHTRLASVAASTSAAYIVLSMAFWITVFYSLTPRVGGDLGAAGWAAVVWTGIVGSALARVLGLEGIRILGGGQAALLMPVETLLSIACSMAVIGERFSPTQAVGAAFVIVTVLMATRSRRFTEMP